VAKQEASGTTYYVYDTENLMTRIDFADGGHNYFAYDADSKRVSKRDSEGFTEFIYQGPDMLKLLLERDDEGVTQAHYTMGDGLEAMRRANGDGIASGTSSFYHYNHLGTTDELTDADEDVTDTYRHDAWGVPLAQTGSTVNPHTYVGAERYYRMAEAGLYHLGFRDYAPRLAMFLPVDPLGRSDESGPEALVAHVLGRAALAQLLVAYDIPSETPGWELLQFTHIAEQSGVGRGGKPPHRVSLGMAYLYARGNPTSAVDPLGLFHLDESCKREPWEDLLTRALPIMGRMTLPSFLDCIDEQCKDYDRDEFEAEFTPGGGHVTIFCGSNWQCRVRGGLQEGVLCGFAVGRGMRLCNSSLHYERCDAPNVECTVLHEMVHIGFRQISERDAAVRACWPKRSCPHSGARW